MKKNKMIALLLLFCSIIMIVGMIINIHVYWFIVDIVVILICGISGFILLKTNKQEIAK